MPGGDRAGAPPPLQTGVNRLRHRHPLAAARCAAAPRTAASREEQARLLSREALPAGRLLLDRQLALHAALFVAGHRADVGEGAGLEVGREGGGSALAHDIAFAEDLAPLVLECDVVLYRGL